MPKTRAILVGVDGYSFLPLTSAVNDAAAVRDALLGRDCGMPVLDAGDVTLLASPGPGTPAPAGAQPATRDAILNALEPYYDGSDDCDRLIFYFAGHGLAASVDGRTRQSLILPVDTSGPEHGRQMISVDELVDLFAERGPREQVWIIDACRDMPYRRRPRAFGVEWNEEDPQSPRAQAVIYAVAPGGKADSVPGGHGRFTGFLLQGLAGQGSAAEYLPALGHQVTVRALHAFVLARVRESLEGYDDWTLAVQAPQLAISGDGLSPLRAVPSPGPKAFAVQIEPPEAHDAVRLALEVEPGISVANWPPDAPPRIYELRASRRIGADPKWGMPMPPLQAVDLREIGEATVRVPTSDPSGDAFANTDPGGSTQALTSQRFGALDPTRSIFKGLKGRAEGAFVVVLTAAQLCI